MHEVTLWHNPRCSKSRAAHALLAARDDVVVTERRYLDDPPTPSELATLLDALGVADVRDVVRTGEAAYRERGLAGVDEDALRAAVVAEPKLLERPIAVVGERAVVGRPPELVLELLP